MKTSDAISLPPVPSLFQIAAFFEDFFPAKGRKQSASAPRHLPIAEFMLNPEPRLNLLQSGCTENHAVAAVAAGEKSAAAPARRPANNRSGNPQKSAAGPGGGKPNGPGPDAVKKVEFRLDQRSARSVKLAGDFTQWEKHPVEMMHCEDGVWSTVVPLSPGLYSYRFIVDGQWCNDPRSGHHVPNPYGSENSVILVSS
jgi:hypothetical protein